MSNKIKVLTSLAVISLLQSCGSVNDAGSVKKDNSYWNDPLFEFSWSLNNTGQNVFSKRGGKPGEDININRAHTVDKLTGKGIKVVISDTGIQEDHPDLRENLLNWERRNYKDNNMTNYYLRPTDAHGTMVSGIVGALGNNGVGSVGIAPEVTMIDFNWLDPNLNLKAEDYKAVKSDQFNGDYDIFNFSWGKSICYPFSVVPINIKNKVRLQATEGRNGKGVIFVQAAGNDFRRKCENKGR